MHIHFKLRSDPAAGRSYEFTSQLYFDDDLSDGVFGREPYARSGERVRNQQDGIFRRGGDQLMLALTERADGFAGAFEVGLQMP